MATRRALRWLLLLGVRQAAGPRERRQARIANAMGLGFVVVSLPYVLLFAVAGSPFHALMLSVGCLGYGAALPLNRAGQYYWARVTPLVSGMAIVGVFSAALGPEWNLQATLFMLTSWAFNLFSMRRNPGTLLCLSLLPGLIYIAIEVGMLASFPRLPVPPWMLPIFSTATLVVGYGLLTWTLWIFYRENERNEDKLLDVVERLQLEVAARKKSQELTEQALLSAERAGQAKSEFLAVMSHELRTPLNGVVGSTDLLLDTALERGQRGLVHTIQSCSAFLLALVNNLLDFAAMETGRVHLESKTFDLVDSLEETVFGFVPRAADKGLALVFDLDPRVPRRIHGDQGRVQQVLANLIDNALKFTHQGRVVVRVWAEGREGDGECRLFLEVRDTGIGVSVDQFEHIFDGFRQQDSTLNRRYEGVGLGLSISRLLARAMNGDISVRRGDESGSIFCADIGLSLARRASSDPPAPLAVEGEMACLVECGDPARARAVAHALQRVGVAVVEAMSPGIAVDAAIVDGHINPERRGAHVRQVAERTGLPEGSVLLLSPSACAEDKALLPCPFRTVDLVSAINALRRPRASGPVPIDPGRTTADRINLGGARILVAEDNRVNQKVLLSMLRKLGAVGEAYPDGQQAVDAYVSEPWAAVLMDIQMPIMDGLAATQRIREIERERGSARVPIIAVSANAMPGDVERGMESGVDAYLSKPLQIGTLESMLAQHLAVTSGERDAPSKLA